MSKKIPYLKDFNKEGVNFIFSFNLYVQVEKLDPKDPVIADMKYYDGWMVYPYDVDDRLYGMAELDGHLILPGWCYPEKPNFNRLRHRIDRKRRQMRNRHPRPVRSTTI